MRLAFLDIETTGLDPYAHEVLEVAYVVRPDDPTLPERTAHFSLSIDVSKASEDALRINRYYERMDDLFLISVTREDAAAKLLLDLTGALVVGNNVAFDLRFLEALLQRQGFAGNDATPWHYAPLDLKSFVAGRCGMRKPANTKVVAEVSGVPLPQDAHTALADAQWNKRVYDALLGKFVGN